MDVTSKPQIKKSVEVPFYKVLPPLNYLNDEWVCKGNLPCKRMSCLTCRASRRTYTILSNYLELRKVPSVDFVSITWLGEAKGSWPVFRSFFNKAGKFLADSRQKFLRVTGVGKRRRHIHAHFLIPTPVNSGFIKYCKRICNDGARTHSATVDRSGGLFKVLGYIYDENFVPSFFDPERPAKMRLISGTRGISFGYPNRQRFEVLNASLQKENFLKNDISKLNVDERRRVEYEINKLRL